MWFLLSRKARRASSGTRLRPSFRPRLEALEDRRVPTAGALDPTFGSGGTVFKDYGQIDPNAGNAAVRSLFIYPSTDAANAGKVLGAGYIGTTNVTHTGDDFALMRYNADGTPDTTFGTGGIVTTDFNSQDDIIYAVTVDAGGKIVVAGSTDHTVMLTAQSGVIVPDFALARYTPTGQLDTDPATGFGPVDSTTGLHAGKFKTTFPGGTSTTVSSTARAITILSDGKILVGGSASVVVGPAQGDFALARYNTDGSLDGSFGSGGLVLTPFLAGMGAAARGMAVQGDGKIVLGGSANNGTDLDFAAARYNADGTLDSTFGSGGKVTTPIGVTTAANDEAAGLALDAGGRVVLVGYTTNSRGLQDTALVRYTTSGILDTTFGSGGKVVTDLGGNDLGRALAVQPDDKIVVAGSATFTTTSKDFALARYNANGTLDSNFGFGGEVATAITTSNDEAIAVALQGDGKIVAGGYANRGFALARYLGDSAGFAVTGFPSPRTAGAAGTVTVTARNADGSTNTGYTGTVHFTSSDPQAVLPADYTFTAADQGVHTFSATLKTAGNQSITATDTATSILSGGAAGIVIQPAAASQFILSAPSSVKSGAKFSLTLTVEDAYGNVVTGYTGTVHFSSSDGTATLPANYTFTAADAGVHTFTSNAVLRKKGKQTVTVTDLVNSTLTTTDSISVG